MTAAKPDLAFRAMILYYAVTALFMLLDYVVGLNIRLTFLDAYPGWRVAYYILCYACLGLMLWRPAWGAYIGMAESLLTLSLIILSTATRVLLVSDEMIETGRGFVSLRELVNFMLAFLVVYSAYLSNLAEVKKRNV